MTMIEGFSGFKQQSRKGRSEKKKQPQQQKKQRIKTKDKM